MKKKIIQLVDGVGYIRNNCFQSQLASSLAKECDLVQVELSHILNNTVRPEADGFISCLKQRSIDRHAAGVAAWLRGAPLVVYDQDPWQAYMDDSPHKGAFDRIAARINVASFALTTQWWVDFVRSRGLPSDFVRMWVLPHHCDRGPAYVDRPGIAGFIGTVHPRRRVMIDIVERGGIPVYVSSTSLAYPDFLQEMGKLRSFIHNEDMPIYIDGKEFNFNTGMWVKDIEAVARGCFSIRGKGEGSETYLAGLSTVKLYDNLEQVPDIIRGIEKMDPSERQATIDADVKRVRDSDVWAVTAQELIRLSLIPKQQHTA